MNTETFQIGQTARFPMQILAEQFEKVLTRVLEAMEIEPDNADRGPREADEFEDVRDRELNADTHHTLIEPCW